MANLMLFSGGSNEALAKRVADKLHLSLGRMDVGRFSDGEVTVEVHENVRGITTKSDRYRKFGTNVPRRSGPRVAHSAHSRSHRRFRLSNAASRNAVSVPELAAQSKPFPLTFLHCAPNANIATSPTHLPHFGTRVCICTGSSTVCSRHMRLSSRIHGVKSSISVRGPLRAPSEV